MMDAILRAAYVEVDKLTPGSEPIAPPPPPRKRTRRETMAEALRLSGFVPRDYDLTWRHPDGRVIDETELELRDWRLTC